MNRKLKYAKQLAHYSQLRKLETNSEMAEFLDYQIFILTSKLVKKG